MKYSDLESEWLRGWYQLIQSNLDKPWDWGYLSYNLNITWDLIRDNPDILIWDWEFISDQVMGGESYGKVEFINEKNISLARMTGNVSLENNGGFIQFRKKLEKKIDNKSKGIKIEARGNIEQYYIHIRTKGTLLPWQYYQAVFSVNSNWKSITVPFKNFKRSGVMLSKNISPINIKSIAIVAYGKEHRALIDISKISIYE